MLLRYYELIWIRSKDSRLRESPASPFIHDQLTGQRPHLIGKLISSGSPSEELDENRVNFHPAKFCG